MYPGKYLLCACLLTIAAPQLLAQTYPQRPVRLIVPYPPGGGTDVPARLLAPKLAEALGQQVVVDNRAGASSIIGSNLAAKATPDGYTLLMVPGGHAINPGLYNKLPYDTAKDFAPISLIAKGAYILTTSMAVPVKTVSDVVALAKAKPGELNFASGGVGNVNHLAAELFSAMAGIKLVHVPYKGGGPIMTDLLGGRISIFFGASATVAPHVRSGKIRALGVTTAKRSTAFPNLPTIAEAGVPGYEVSGWYGLLAPAKTRAAIVDRLSREMAKVVRTEEVRDSMVNLIGLEPVGSTPAQLDALIKVELRKWEKVIRMLGISAEY